MNIEKKSDLTPLNVCIQVNLQKELSKQGVYLGHLVSLAKTINKFSHFHLRCLMAIPKPKNEFSIQRKKFQVVVSNFKKIASPRLALGYFIDGHVKRF